MFLFPFYYMCKSPLYIKFSQSLVPSLPPVKRAPPPRAPSPYRPRAPSSGDLGATMDFFVSSHQSRNLGPACAVRHSHRCAQVYS